MILVCLVDFSDPASLIFFCWEELGPALTIQVNWWSNVIKSCHVEWRQISLYWLTSQSMLQLKCLFMDTHNAELQNSLEYYMLVSFVKAQFSNWIWDSKPAGISLFVFFFSAQNKVKNGFKTVGSQCLYYKFVENQRFKNMIGGTEVKSFHGWRGDGTYLL